MIIFRYKSERGRRGQQVLRPVADVWLKKGNSWIEFHPYIDSGADVSLIPLSLGELLGFEVNKDKIEEIGGIKGAVPVIYKRWPMKIGSETLKVLFAWALIEEVPPLLGRADIFEVFEVTFKQKKRKIIFKRKGGL